MSEELGGYLRAGLNKLIVEGQLGVKTKETERMKVDEEKIFYEPNLFEEIDLSVKTYELIERIPEGKSLMRLNRRLLEEIFPNTIQRYWLFTGADIVEPEQLAERLNRGEDTVSRYVKERLPVKCREAIANPRGMEISELANVLAVGLNEVATAGVNIYEPNLFEEAFVTDTTSKAVEENPSGEELVVCNTYLLEEAFIWSVRKSRRPEVYLPWQMVSYLLVGFVVTIVVSLFTKPESKEKLDKFYECIRTPIGQNEPETIPFTLPDGVKPAPRTVLIEHPDFEIPKPSLVSVIGFLAGWAGVALMIGIFFWIMSSGA